MIPTPPAYLESPSVAWRSEYHLPRSGVTYTKGRTYHSGDATKFTSRAGRMNAHSEKLRLADGRWEEFLDTLNFRLNLRQTIRVRL